MSTEDEVKQILKQTLRLDARIQSMNEASALLGALPELDSMAVVNLIAGIEEHFGFLVSDDEISADAFATLGSLVQFVEEKLAA